MKKHYFLLSMATLALSATVSAQTAGETVFSYADPDAATRAIGLKARTAYDVAIRIDNPSFVGYQVLGISVDIPVVDGCACAPEAKAWLTSELFINPKDYTNVPDISDPEGVPGTIVNVGTEDAPQYRLDIDFPEPYTIPKEGVYVGYTVTVTALKNSTGKYPVSVASSATPAGGLFMHAGQNRVLTAAQYSKWTDYSEAQMAVSTMRVRLKGSKTPYSAKIQPEATLAGTLGQSATLSATLFNYGGEPISSVEYVYTAEAGDILPAVSGSGTLSLDTPLAEDGRCAVSIPVEIPGVAGDYNVTLTTGTLDGNANAYDEPVAPFTIMAREWIPKRRALVEEFTGLWCGWCPEAYVVVSQLEQKRPDDFVTIAYHKEDSMAGVDQSLMPNALGAPGININRSRVDNFRTLEQSLDESLKELAPAEIEVDLTWTDAKKTILRPEARVRFAEAAEAGRYRIGYAVVEDNYCNPAYTQHNYFGDASQYTDDYYKGPFWDLFIGKAYEVSGIVYNDVAEFVTDPAGLESSIPDAVEANQTVTHFITVDPAEFKVMCASSSAYGKSVVWNRDNLRAIAILLDTKTGKVVNAATSIHAGDAPVYSQISGIEGVESAADVVKTEYFSLDGMRLSHLPEKGAVIVVETLSDGTARTAKRLQ